MTGATNSSLFVGDIDYQTIQPFQGNMISYWTLPLTSQTVNSGSVSLPSGLSSYTVIDTGTTLVGGPADQVTTAYALISVTGNYEGYYTYRTESHRFPLLYCVDTFGIS
jgi:hypothetical protein